MIISRTPLRISFVGGGSDLPEFYAQHQGAVVSTAIDKYIYITVNKKFDQKIRASYSDTEIVDRVDDLKHELIREALKMTLIVRGIEITSISDIPSGTGLGSSSTYTVGLLNALYAMLGAPAGAEKLAQQACQVEINRLKKPIGRQDQYIAAFGGFQFIQFNKDGSVFVDPIICTWETKHRLQQNLLLLYMDIPKRDFLNQQVKTISDKNRIGGLIHMVNLAWEMKGSLEKNDLSAFGELLDEDWREKKALGDIADERVDGYYEIAKKHGAIGGKVLGSGGGFLLLYAPLEEQEKIVNALPELKPVDFRFEPQGSKIIYVE